MIDVVCRPSVATMSPGSLSRAVDEELVFCGCGLVGVVAAYVDVGKPGAVEHQEQLVTEVRPDGDLAWCSQSLLCFVHRSPTSSRKRRREYRLFLDA